MTISGDSRLVSSSSAEYLRHIPGQHSLCVEGVEEVERFFDPSSLPGPEGPVFALIVGAVAVGKTRHRRANHASGYVVVDAGDIFISLSRGRYLDFPSTLEVPMEWIGTMVARRAVAENRSIVSEVTATASEPLMALIDAMTSIGYRVNVIAIEKDIAESWQWNLQRSRDNISSYYTEAFHLRWLLAGIEERKARVVTDRPEA